MNLIKDPWIWVIRKDGTRHKIAPIQMNAQYKTNPVLRVDFARPDFSAMATQFLVALMQTYFAPLEENAWQKNLRYPPTSKDMLDKIDHSKFHMDGDGYRFMQDMNPEDLVNTYRINSLFFESPGESTIKEGKDFFQSEDAISTVCPSCAAVALYSKQVNATPNGSGWNTAIRSGIQAPITTLIMGKTLWETVYYNVLNVSRMDSLDNKPTFSWLEKTVISETINDEKKVVSLKEKSFCYPLWEMPCRYHLIFEETDDACDICGDHSTKMVKSMKGKNKGNKYVDPRHTLSPYLKNDKGIMYRRAYSEFSNTDYPSFVDYLIGDKAKDRFPAQVVENFMAKGISGAQLWAYGYILESKKYFGWIEKIWSIPDVVGKETSINTLISMVAKVGYSMEYMVKQMLLTHRDLKKNMSMVRENFFKATEDDFYAAINNPDLSMWLHILVMKAFEVFDWYVGSHKIGLQIYLKESFIEKMNKEITKKMELPLLNPEIFIKRSSFKHSVKYFQIFSPENKTQIMSWWKKQEMHSENHALFSRCASFEEITELERFQSFMYEFKKTLNVNGESLEVISNRMAAGMLILSRISQSKINLNEILPVQLAQINSRHADEIFHIKDSLKDWKAFERVIEMLPSVNILSFLEGFVSWNPKVKRYWEKIYRTVTK